MKIDRLYTLSQFVDLIKLREFDNQTDNYDDFALRGLGLIYRYNDFLKQPLKKETFVNEEINPYIGGLGEPVAITREEGKQWDKWQEAEKKVIFKGITCHGINLFSFNDGSYLILSQFDNLYQIAESTNGELELQNVEL